MCQTKGSHPRIRIEERDSRHVGAAFASFRFRVRISRTHLADRSMVFSTGLAMNGCRVHRTIPRTMTLSGMCRAAEIT